ncbi:hypothetical protein V5O48_003399 [Marasmius crinis-equi]|uniref:Uncharacterized protein n=1 Tax=Marasmius crinis-equi TaxID=585013 RepID=A0ABR3FT22_9AGAR
MNRIKQVAAHLTGTSGVAALERKSPDDVVVTMAIRSPLCKARRGGFKDARTDELLLEMFKASHSISHSKVDPSTIGDICVGVVLAPDSVYHARGAALAAGIPETVPVQTINRFCSSGLMAITTISNQIRCGQIEVGLAVGVESMSENPDKGGPSQSELVSCNAAAADCPKPMGWTSENVAADFSVTREEQDEFAALSHQRAEHADKAGYFAKEIVPFTVFQKDAATGEKRQVVVSKDDGIRPGTTKEKLSKIKSAFPQWGNSTTTGGNASQITDGAAAVMLMTRRKAEELGLKILGKHVSTAVVGLPPRIMGIGPVYAIPAVLQNVGITQNDVDLFEVNEAFASQCVYTIKRLELPIEKVNVNGGACALGHPLGCTGARQVATGLNELERRNGKILVTSMCIGTVHKMASYNTLNPNHSTAGHPNYSSTGNNGDYGNNANPYGSGDPYYSQSTGYITPVPQKKGTSPWVKFGIPIGILVIIGAVVGVVVGIKAHNKSSSSSSGGGAAAEAAASSAASAKLSLGRFATATNSEFMVPIYPSTTNSAVFGQPTFIQSSNKAISWPADSFKPTSPSPTSVRTDRPRLIAPAYMWEALPDLIKGDPYLKGWNDTIFQNASDWLNADPVKYFMDGDSGILDNAREIKARIKAFAYVYRMTKDTKWVDRTWLEVKNAAGNGTTPFGPDDDRWNSNHFLDAAEFSAAYAIAYDWLHDVWTDEQKSQIRFTLNKYGLSYGVRAYTDTSVFFGWWRNNIFGNWNCVCNGGLTMASLAILGEDETNNAETLLGLTVDNAKQNCANAVTDDGTWKETANYWYFGTTGHAEMTSVLLTATGSHYGLADTNPNFQKTGDYHMHAYGPTSLFDWGDHGPNKFSSTANSMILYANVYNRPEFALFQREQHDAAEPWSMFWYNPSISGAYWDNRELDAFFDNDLTQWAAMRSSWTDLNALFVAMKAGKNQGHETHNDLDVGDFVLDALGTRWAGEFGSADYRSPNYFSNDTQASVRWTYYRKMTEGQNTILVNKANQNVAAAPKILNKGSSGTKQGSSTVFSVPDDSTAFWTVDTTSAYFDVSSAKRGVRMLNGRKQVLVQDEITSTDPIQWRMHTNATVTVDGSGSSATLTRDGKTMTMQILSPSGAKFTTSAATRFTTDPAPPVLDQENPGITVVIIELAAGTNNIQVLFNPQWGGNTKMVTPSSVNLDNWSLDSHN